MQSEPVVEAPMQFRGPLPAVEVHVNGQGPFLFVIDTGAGGMARADASLVEKLKLPDIGQVAGSDGGSGNPRAMKLVRFNTLKIGSLEFRDVEAASRNYNVPNLPHIDGILGFNLFADYLLTLDYAAKRVRVEKGRLPKANGSDILSFDSPRGVPTVDLVVGDSSVKAHIDTGNSIGAFVLPSGIAEKLTFGGDPVTVGKARTISSEVEIKQAPLKGSIKLGSFEFSNPLITYPAVSQNANIGSRAFTEFALTFDQKNNVVRLTKATPPKLSP
jgi:predicted aspartyl protease